MSEKSFTKIFIWLILLLSGMITSCQKDQDVKQENTANTAFTTDGALPGVAANYLAVKGTLKLTIQDSTYTFDAAQDSIAFVNVHSGNNHYFGITAINKAHNMSFGISSEGAPASNSNSPIAGSQFLLRTSLKPDVEYALSKFAQAQDFGKMSLSAYKQDTVLASGTFYTFLAKDAKATSLIYRVKGEFSLQLK